MSFGFSVGDFMHCINLVNDIRCRIIDAPEQWKAVAEDVKLLAIALQEANNVLPRRDLTPSQEDLVDKLQKGCEEILGKLREILDHSQKVIEIKGRRLQIEVLWKKVTWDQKQIERLRAQIAWNLDGLNLLLQQVTSNAIFELRTDVSRLHEREDKKEKHNKRRAILDWLSTIDHVSRQRDIATKRQPGTGNWLLNSPEVTDWLSKDGETLFCQGIPGTGKTVLASVVISQLKVLYQDDTTVGIAYLYFTYQPQHEQVLPDLFGSLVKQLIPESQPIPSEIEDLFESYREGVDPMAIMDLRAALAVVMRPLSKVFIVLDALDEYHASAPKDLEDFLIEIMKVRKMHPFSLFATSRYVSEIASQLGVYVTKDIRANENDLRLYINTRMREMRWKMFESVEIHESIRKEVLKAADGMFLLARLHMDTLVGQPTVGDLEDALKDLPKGLHELDQTYDQAMQRINSQQGKLRELAHKILMWIIYAKRALSTWEIREALAIRPGQTNLDLKYRPELETIDSLCAGLVTVDANSEIVQLVHYTTKEYFTAKDVFPDAHAILAEICITCLSFDIFKDKAYLAYPWHSRPTRMYEYAAIFWGHHAKASSYRRGLIFDFLRDIQKSSSCLEFCLSQGGFLTYGKEALGIYLAALAGLHDLMDTLIEGGASPSIGDLNGRTPLWYAIWNGQCETVKYLAAHYDVHLDPDFQDNFPLAVQRGHFDIVKFMLPMIAQGTKLPLIDAVCSGNIHMVDMFLNDGRVDWNLRDKIKGTALHYALELKHEAIAMRLLTTREVDPGLRNTYGATPFLLAAEHGLLAVVEHLLKRKYVDYGVIDDFGLTAFMSAVIGGNLEIVNLLLRKTEVQPDAVDFENRTVISHAAQRGHLEVLDLLLSYNIPADTEDKLGRTPFWYAACNGNLEAIKFLLSKHTVRTEHKDNKGQTPFSAAAGYDRTQVLRFLYSKCQADVESRDHDGRTPLFHAVTEYKSPGNLQSIEYLISIGADVNTSNNWGQTVLQCTALSEEIEVLLKAGAGPDEDAIEAAIKNFGYESEVLKIVKARVASKKAKVENEADSDDIAPSGLSESPTNTRV